MMWFKRKPFHQTAAWQKLARQHKNIEFFNDNWKCVDCDYTGLDMESDHVLPQKKFKLSRLWMRNLVLRCGSSKKPGGGNGCNIKKAAYVILSGQTITLLILYFIVWFTRYATGLSVVTLAFWYREDVFLFAEAVAANPLIESLTEFLTAEFQEFCSRLTQSQSTVSQFQQSSFSDHDYVPQIDE